MILRSHDPKVTWSDQVDNRFRIIGHGYSDQMSRTVAENRVLKRDIYIRWYVHSPLWERFKTTNQ